MLRLRAHSYCASSFALAVFIAVLCAQGNVAYAEGIPAAAPQFALKQVWELTTIYFPSKDIAALERGVIQVNAKIRAIRGTAPGREGSFLI